MCINYNVGFSTNNHVPCESAVQHQIDCNVDHVPVRLALVRHQVERHSHVRVTVVATQVVLRMLDNNCK